MEDGYRERVSVTSADTALQPWYAPLSFGDYQAGLSDGVGGARIKGCVKERRRTFLLRVHQRLPG